MIVYISGKITGDENYREKFAAVEKVLNEKGYKVINPCRIGEYGFFSYEQYLHIDFALIDCSDALYMLTDWQDSEGATRERHYAEAKGKMILFQPYK